MNDTNPPVPSLKSLIIATAFATLLAMIILISAVLPAEYGIDPTGLGKMMGLTALSAQSKATSQALAIASPALPPQAAEISGQDQTTNQTESVQKQSQPQWQDSVKIVVPAGDSLEYKFHLAKDAVLEYSWTTDGGKLYFDFHGEPQGDKTGYFKSFMESTDNQSNGTLTAPFEGPHGWYWENKTRSPVTIILNTKGPYRILGIM